MHFVTHGGRATPGSAMRRDGAGEAAAGAELCCCSSRCVTPLCLRALATTPRQKMTATGTEERGMETHTSTLGGVPRHRKRCGGAALVRLVTWRAGDGTGRTMHAGLGPAGDMDLTTSRRWRAWRKWKGRNGFRWKGRNGCKAVQIPPAKYKGTRRFERARESAGSAEPWCVRTVVRDAYLQKSPSP